MSGLPGQQMAGRYRTVALQAVGVALIAAIIFIAFLRPSEPGDLSGIDASDGPDIPNVQQPKDPKDPKKRGGREDDDRRGSPNENGRRLGLGALAALLEGFETGNGVGPGGGSIPTDPGDGGGGGEDPPDNQYGDLPGALMAEVGTPAIFREIIDP